MTQLAVELLPALLALAALAPITGLPMPERPSDPFGSLLGNAAPNENPQQIAGTALQQQVASFVYDEMFPGQHRDRESGKFYNYFRDYDSAVGRYTTSDPIGLRGGVNTFGYVGGNPLTRFDPFGLYWEWCQANGQMNYVDNETGQRTPAGQGYSGNYAHRNNPDSQNIIDKGPIPVGVYDLGDPHRYKHIYGKYSMRLKPKPGNIMYDRHSFWLHQAIGSTGCIAMFQEDDLKKIADSKDRELRVVRKC